MTFPYDVREMWNKAFRQSGSNTKIAVDIDQPIEIEQSIVTKIINSPDTEVSYEFADFGTMNERVTKMTYYSASVGQTVERTFQYILDGQFYKLEKKITNLI